MRCIEEWLNNYLRVEDRQKENDQNNIISSQVRVKTRTTRFEFLLGGLIYIPFMGETVNIHNIDGSQRRGILYEETTNGDLSLSCAERTHLGQDLETKRNAWPCSPFYCLDNPKGASGYR